MVEEAAPVDAAADRWHPSNRQAMWAELDRLVGKGSRGVGHLAPAEVERLSKLYRAAANHLAVLRGMGGTARATEDLNSLVSRAHALVYARVARRKTGMGWSFPLLAFPATVRATWRYHLVAAVLLSLGGLYGYFGAAYDPDWSLDFVTGADDDRSPFADPELLRKGLLTGRAGEVDADVKAVFAAFLWTHNTRIGLMCFFLGFLCGVPTVILLVLNGVLLGTYSYTFHHAGLAYEWWAWVLPHGVTELLAIVLLAGGGLWIGHMIVAPGTRTRRERLRQARGDVVRLLSFAFPMFFVAALLESFVRQSALGDTARYWVASTSALLWLGYLGLTRPSARMLVRVLQPAGLLDRAVPLPDREEILGLLERGASR